MGDQVPDAGLSHVSNIPNHLFVLLWIKLYHLCVMVSLVTFGVRPNAPEIGDVCLEFWWLFRLEVMSFFSEKMRTLS